MKKFKKYIYPFIFAISCFLAFMILAILLDVVLPSDDYSGLVYAGVFLIIWVAIIVPVYCIKYGQIIKNEKFKFPFALYNAIVLAFSYILPFGREGKLYIYGVVLLVWVSIWSFLPLVIKLDSTKERGDDNPSDVQE